MIYSLIIKAEEVEAALDAVTKHLAPIGPNIISRKHVFFREVNVILDAEGDLTSLLNYWMLEGGITPPFPLGALLYWHQWTNEEIKECQLDQVSG